MPSLNCGKLCLTTPFPEPDRGLPVPSLLRRRPGRRILRAPSRPGTRGHRGNAITASSVTTRSTGRNEVIGSVHFFDDLRGALGGVLHGHDDTLGAGHQIHGTAHARHHLVGDHPIGKMPLLIDLQAAEHREVEMTAADEAERHGAIECAGAGKCGDRAPAGVGQRGMRHAFLRRRAGADQSVLGLEEDVHALRHDSLRPASEFRCRDSPACPAKAPVRSGAR